ncbi:dihydroxyacetone kinase phosphoryl donor subunit DhaM [Cellulomonas soli]|uniref:Phosphocarrier protein HPr n=1 Tax=Cellulomonas soli TaxID=931535 RepID=A0A512PBA1_9CELL|nr:dihydroxyacetone kinase phosphoryl donor subunit DhaM [Cellulomonas soli]NYI61096.1 PTS hybrid protein [Cellulomonas soli]GEP68487.1 hypothetical protein CSO01_12020 [Cellulomonas soli]
MSGSTTALVLVSHSTALATGAVELAAQMAPGVTILAAGGMDDGTLGTSYEKIEGALLEATADGRAAVVLTDLGSAVLTTESVLEMLHDDVVARVRLADAPFVEGAVAAAVTAFGGAGLTEVLASAEQAGATFARSAGAQVPVPVSPTPAGPNVSTVNGSMSNGSASNGLVTEGAPSGAVSAVAVLRNPLGLHARPAALMARMLAGFDAQVRVNGVNAASVLELMKLGATQGQQLQVVAEGPQGEQAVAAFVQAVEEGFGEV